MKAGDTVIYFKSHPGYCEKIEVKVVGPCRTLKNKWAQRMRILLPDGRTVSVMKESLEKKR